MFWHDRWCKQRLEWWQKLLFYRRCSCPKNECHPFGEED